MKSRSILSEVLFGRRAEGGEPSRGRSKKKARAAQALLFSGTFLTLVFMLHPELHPLDAPSLATTAAGSRIEGLVHACEWLARILIAGSFLVILLGARCSADLTKTVSFIRCDEHSVGRALFIFAACAADYALSELFSTELTPAFFPFLLWFAFKDGHPKKAPRWLGLGLAAGAAYAAVCALDASALFATSIAALAVDFAACAGVHVAFVLTGLARTALGRCG